MDLCLFDADVVGDYGGDSLCDQLCVDIRVGRGQNIYHIDIFDGVAEQGSLVFEVEIKFRFDIQLEHRSAHVRDRHIKLSRLGQSTLESLGSLGIGF